MIGGDGVLPGVSCKQSAVHGAKHKRLHSPGVHHMVGSWGKLGATNPPVVDFPHELAITWLVLGGVTLA